MTDLLQVALHVYPVQFVSWSIAGRNSYSIISSVLSCQTQPVEPSVSASHMERTIQAIKARVLTRVSLQSQLHSLGKGVLDSSFDLCKLDRIDKHLN